MITISVTIPTLKSRDQIQPLIEELLRNVDITRMEVIASCIKQSAAHNRNWCIDNAKGKYVIMVDDDMTGFYPGWVDDLLKPLMEAPEKFNVVSARLLTKDKKQGPQLGGDNYIPTQDIQVCMHPVVNNIVCSAAIAFIKEDGIRFDVENFQFACYEDTDFCMSYMKKFPQRNVVINNRCKLIHLGESKGRNTWQQNKDNFAKKWGIKI